MAEAVARTTGARLLSGTLWNAAGRGLPLVLALALTPLLVHQMGIDRWGLFTLALALVGVFGVFDLGVGAALTRAIATRLGSGDMADATASAGAALAALLGLSVLIGGVAFAAVPSLVAGLLNTPPDLRQEAILAFRLLCLAAPLVVVNAALWGVLAAHQRFREANLATIPVAIFYYAGPALVLLAWQSLVGVILALLVCRLANTLSYLWLARRDMPGLGLAWPRTALVAPLLRMGGWMSASGVLTQALLYADRFLIGAVLTLSAVAFYATPLDLVMRMWILPVAVAQALLPAMAASYLSAAAATVALLRRGALLVMALVLPACLILVVAGPWLLGLWLGAEFAAGGGRVLQLLALGIFFSCAAFAPGALLDAIGRPEANALWQLAQAALFLPLSFLLLLRFGIEGAALAWALRCAADAAGRLLLCAHVYPAAREAARAMLLPLAAGGGGLGAALLLPPALGAAAALVGLGLFLAAAALSLAPEERRDARILIRRPGRLRAVLRGEPA
jgi:O-antigen/teichoic acid export membrane protein